RCSIVGRADVFGRAIRSAGLDERPDDASRISVNSVSRRCAMPPDLAVTPWQAAWEYWTDAAQRTVLFWDVMRKRGHMFLEHERKGKPPMLIFEHEMVLAGRPLERPVNSFLVRIVPPAGTRVDARKRPFVVVDPRAGHGPGIGGFKADSEIGVALRAGHPCY